MIQKLCPELTTVLTCRMRKRFMRRTLATTLVCASLAMLAACGKEEAKPQARPPTEVSVIKIVSSDTPISFEYVAQTESGSAQLVDSDAWRNRSPQIGLSEECAQMAFRIHHQIRL